LLDVRAPSFQSAFASQASSPSHADPAAFTSFSALTIQGNCNRQGINPRNDPSLEFGDEFLRLGIWGNNEADCASSDSLAGVGLFTCDDDGQPVSAGLEAGAQVGGGCARAFARIYARDDDFSFLGDAPSCLAHLADGALDDGHYLVNGVLTRCDMTTDGGGFTAVVDFDAQRDPCSALSAELASDVDAPLLACQVPVGATVAETRFTAPAPYTEILGRAIAYERGRDDAFAMNHEAASADDIWLDGIGVVRAPQSSAHVIHAMSFAAAVSDYTAGNVASCPECTCPCQGGLAPPAFVDPDAVRCASGFHFSDEPGWSYWEPLFDGVDGPDGDACDVEASDAPIHVTLPVSVHDDLVVRLSHDEVPPEDDENIAVARFELYVR
jgi:hypothetical protein